VPGVGLEWSLVLPAAWGWGRCGRLLPPSFVEFASNPTDLRLLASRDELERGIAFGALRRFGSDVFRRSRSSVMFMRHIPHSFFISWREPVKKFMQIAFAFVALAFLNHY
jgi:hypothetical protein